MLTYITLHIFLNDESLRSFTICLPKWAVLIMNILSIITKSSENGLTI